MNIKKPISSLFIILICLFLESCVMYRPLTMHNARNFFSNGSCQDLAGSVKSAKIWGISNELKAEASYLQAKCRSNAWVTQARRNRQRGTGYIALYIASTDDIYGIAIYDINKKRVGLSLSYNSDVLITATPGKQRFYIGEEMFQIDVLVEQSRVAMVSINYNRRRDLTTNKLVDSGAPGTYVTYNVSSYQHETLDIYDDNAALFQKLIKAIRNKHVKKIKMFVEDGVNVNDGNNYGYTPLLAAVKTGSYDIVQLVLNSGADVNAPNRDCDSPLHIANQKEYLRIAELLKEYGAVDNNAQKCKIKFDDTLIVEKISLHTASLKGCHADAFKLLLDAGAYVDAVDSLGRSVLYYAPVRGCVNIVRLLIDSGADVNITGRGGSTPLFTASSLDRTSIVKLLIDAGADVNALIDDGKTLLHIPARNCYTDTFKLLLDAGADMNAADHNGNTPMHVASSKSCTDIVNLLLEAGADANSLK